MKHRTVLAVLLAAVPFVPAAAASGAVERGDYLVRIMACNDCHTPLVMGENGPEPDMGRMLSGHPAGAVLPAPPAALSQGPWSWAGAASNTAYAGPWGVSFAANLTPDPQTGLGSWTEETFVRAIRTGRHMGVGRPILPPMPAPAYSAATDDDLKAIWAYLQTVKPVHNAVPQPIEPVEAHGP